MAGNKGSTLPKQTQTDMEKLFGADFSNVRVHTNSAMPPMGAKAFASGSDIFFRSGEYNPHTNGGRNLLAHELTHVVQQAQGRVKPRPAGNGLNGNADPELEREAEEMAGKAVNP